MDLLTTILTCSLYLADDDLVRAIAASTPEKNPFFVVDASVDATQIDPPPPPQSAHDALARTQAIAAQGGRPLLGLLQVPPVWLSAFGRDLADAFDPCTNIAVGTAMLSAFDFDCAAWASNVAPKPPQRHVPSAARRRCVLRKYEEAIGLPDFAAVTTLELHAQRPMPPPVADAPILAPFAASRSGPDSLLVPPSLFFPPASASTP
jgi:hypothetical protein